MPNQLDWYDYLCEYLDKLIKTLFLLKYSQAHLPAHLHREEPVQRKHHAFNRFK